MAESGSSQATKRHLASVSTTRGDGVIILIPVTLQL
jgi:hypothetical protein